MLGALLLALGATTSELVCLFLLLLARRLLAGLLACHQLASLFFLVCLAKLGLWLAKRGSPEEATKDRASLLPACPLFALANSIVIQLVFASLLWSLDRRKNPSSLSVRDFVGTCSRIAKNTTSFFNI